VAHVHILQSLWLIYKCTHREVCRMKLSKGPVHIDLAEWPDRSGAVCFLPSSAWNNGSTPIHLNTFASKDRSCKSASSSTTSAMERRLRKKLIDNPRVSSRALGLRYAEFVTTPYTHCATLAGCYCSAIGRALPTSTR